MITLLYKKMIKVALDNTLMEKRSAVRLFNLLKYGKLTCEICMKPINKRNKKLKCSIDHIIPISKGGDEQYKNLRIAHRICNIKKGDK